MAGCPSLHAALAGLSAGSLRAVRPTRPLIIKAVLTTCQFRPGRGRSAVSLDRCGGERSMHLVVLGMVFLTLIVALGCWLAYQVLGQNGRLLQRLDALEARLETLPAGGRGAVA